jgi:F-type H+-transporting ATPase subunit delta
MSAVAKRYAVAFLSATAEQKCLDAVEQDVTSLLQLLETSPEFATFVVHPLLTPEEQRATVNALFKGKAHALTLKLFDVLIERERLPDLAAILEQALDLIKVEKGILAVDVVSAEPFLKRQEDELSKKLAARTGKTIELTTRVDESLIGGFRLRIGDVVEDYSLVTKLETFKQNVINA